MQLIQTAAKILSFLSVLSAAGTGIVLLASLFRLGWLVFLLATGGDTASLWETTKFAYEGAPATDLGRLLHMGVITTLVPIALWRATLYYRLFDSIAQGHLFTEPNCLRLQHIAVLSLAEPLAKFALGGGLSTSEFASTCTLWFISWVLQEANKLKADQDLVV